MVGSELELTTIEVEVGDNETRSVEYAVQINPDKVSIFMRYEGEPSTYTLEYWPPTLKIDDGRVVGLVQDWAGLIYDNEKASGD